MGCTAQYLENGVIVERDCHTGQLVGGPPQPGPSLLTRAANFAKSAAAHVAAGMPRASDEEIERRFAICQGCEFYDGRACTKCGCPVVRESKFVSKLAWANEKCPAGKWGAVTAN